MIASLTVVEGSGGYLFDSFHLTHKNLIMSQELVASSCCHWSCRSTVATCHVASPVQPSSQATSGSLNLQCHISRESGRIEKTSLCCQSVWEIIIGGVCDKETAMPQRRLLIGVHIFGCGVAIDLDHFTAKEKILSGELWRIPDVKLKWNGGSSGESVGKKPRGGFRLMTELLRAVVASVITGMAMVAVSAAAAEAAVSTVDGYSHIWLVAKTMSTAVFFFILIKVQLHLFALHLVRSDNASVWGRTGCALCCELVAAYIRSLIPLR
jgi:hypothetical protein